MTDGSSPFPTPARGERFGRYQIIRRLGEGGMGIVYEAEHADLGKRVALKTLRPAFVGDAEVVGRFVREGMAAARIRHPNVVDVTDVGTERGRPYLVMELLDGETLRDRLRARGPLGAEAVAALLLPVCAAVAAAHARGVLHRDLKPDNIFLERTPHGAERPKVLDFGIAKILDEDASLALTTTASVVGTPLYMSPEQARGVRALDARSDQYALGLILYECSTGQQPFAGSSLLALVAEITAGVMRPPRDLRPDLSPEFEAVVLRALARDPADRFDSVRALGAALLPLADDRTQIVWDDAFDPPAEPSPPTVRTPPSSLPAVALAETRPRTAAVIATPRPSRARWIAALALALLVPAAVVAYVSRSTPAARVARPAPRPLALVATPAAVDAATAAPVDARTPALPDAAATAATARPTRVLPGSATGRRPPPGAPERREIPME